MLNVVSLWTIVSTRIIFQFFAETFKLLSPMHSYNTRSARNDLLFVSSYNSVKFGRKLIIHSTTLIYGIKPDHEWWVTDMHVSTYAIFNFDTRLSHALFLITGLLVTQLMQKWDLLRLRSHMQKFIWISLVNKKLMICWFLCFTNKSVFFSSFSQRKFCWTTVQNKQCIETMGTTSRTVWFK